MKAAGVGLLILGYALLYAGLSNISTGGQGYGFLQSLGFKGNGGIGINTQNFISAIVPGGSGTSSSSSNGSGSVQPASAPVQNSQSNGGVSPV